MTYFLTLEDVTDLGIAMMAVEDQEFLIADAGLLGSALARPQVSAFEQDAYPTLHDKAAALMESLARNHGLVDGSKRLAWAATKLFLLFNEVTLRAPSPEVGEHFVLDIARGYMDRAQIAATLREWSESSERID